MHLLGLVSDGGVHSSLEHLRALIALAAELSPSADLVVHAFTDGRDTLPHAGAGFLARARRRRRARASGRSWGATGRWTATAAGTARSAPTTCSSTAARRTTPTSGEQAVRAAYERGETDEFIEPTLVGEEARIRPGDSVSASTSAPTACARSSARSPSRASAAGRERGVPQVWHDGPDGTRELPGWEGRGGAPPVRRLATLTEYEEGWPLPGRVRARAPRDDLSPR